MVNIFNAYDTWRNRREDRMEKIVAEATDYTYEVFVRELKENNEFDKERQKEAMQMVFDYVQSRIGYDYSDRTIKVLAEQRLLFMKAKMMPTKGMAMEAKQLFDDERAERALTQRLKIKKKESDRVVANAELEKTAQFM
eukprot:CAMPEP_0197032408 /NCGR_PEP_ID=MMETSP1384-20130603/11098_1 /TAXON_ID=29189 /ORGANISM="Ammonia sp." /LENGTH=138 /DNA_ID=CAMNT_0042462061 /DNA_START=174 /DNA_END=590 /DNA_ORIENTATION=-